ncbi:concanavalin A-like lectin/glucanase superfamily protein [Fibrobacter sp. UWR4]|uniref:LamG-like jellyroll fold domain-containing protein n=1 Tax=Fibrobacter sp. UWR4 TaxID=1896218 RepID=UPI000D6C4E83|nr:LamG-like jellyroll fold domain-containing protein [Fibrobacter sp. UWR4]PWJ61897.1 concanavalin A-like lectin/glucanase superfamily protein [Fibrobacter sp. UWR4]
MKKLYSIQILAVILSWLVTLCACSEKKDVAGGITDIDHSVAGRVLDVAGSPVAHARVVAYIDNSTAVEDSVETVSDAKGNYELVFNRDVSGDTVMLYAELDSLVALENVESSQNFDLQVSAKKKLVGSVSGANSGFVRIKGTSLKAKIADDGSFEFDLAPAGKRILLQYVRDDLAVATFAVSTAGTSDSIALPEFIETYLSMDGKERVFENDSTLAESVDYVDGIFGKAIALKPGQFIDLGELDPTNGDFTISLWTKWKGTNGNHQILAAQRSYWSDSTSKFQWHFDNVDGKFAVMKSAPKVPVEITFGDSSVVPVDEWSFLVLVSKDNQVSMYVNGKQVGETSSFTSNLLEKAVPFRIGGNEIPTETWNGLLDEVRVENVARDLEWIINTFQTHF